MNLRNKIFWIFIIFIFSIFLTTTFFLTCSKEKEEDEKPEIVSCKSVRYQGYTYKFSSWCSYGESSFDTRGTIDGHKFAFHITCSGGCINSVSVIGGSLGKTIVGP